MALRTARRLLRFFTSTFVPSSPRAACSGVRTLIFGSQRSAPSSMLPLLTPR